MKRQCRRVLLVVLLGICITLLFGCARRRIQPTPAPVPPVKPDLALVVYYSKFTEENDAYLVREVHLVPQTQDPKRAAVEELINGQPQTPGAFRVLPKGTRVLGIKVVQSVATVDFSKEVLNANVGASGEDVGIKSIVYTLTEFPDVRQVAFTVNGAVDQRAMDWWGHVGLYQQPFRRDDPSQPSVVREPVIWVTSPQPGTKVSSPLDVTGSAMVFEAAVSLRLVTGDGRKLAEEHTNASIGAPGRGDFSARLNFTSPGSGDGFLEVFWNSPKDGSELDKVRVPVKF